MAFGVFAAANGVASADTRIGSMGAHQVPAQHAPVGGDVIPGRFIVRYESASSSTQRRDALASVVGETVRERIAPLDAAVLDLDPDARGAAIRELRAHRAVRSVEPDVRLRSSHVDCRSNAACVVPGDTHFRYQWGLQNDAATTHFANPFTFGSDIAAPLAWKQSLGSTSTRVAVLDSGIDTAHEDLVGRIVHSASAFSDGGVDVDGHGTHVAGIIGASHNGSGIAGVAPNVAIYNIKALDDSGATSCGIAANAIAYAVDLGVNVINASFGGNSYCGLLEDAVDYAWNRDVLVVAAAGNDGTSTPTYPAALGNALSVGATTSTDASATWSSHGSWVAIAAPGDDILSNTPGGYAVASGTSQAAPFVSGVASLIWSSVPDANGDGYRSDDVVERLVRYTDEVPGSGTHWVSGRVNACRAMTADAGVCPSPGPVTTPPASPAPSPTPTAPAVPAPTTAPSPSTPVAPGTSKPVTVASRLSASMAKRATDKALTRRYRSAWTKGRSKQVNCKRVLSRTTRRCAVSWRKSRSSYRGSVTVRARTDRAADAAISVRRVRR